MELEFINKNTFYIFQSGLLKLNKEVANGTNYFTRVF